MLIGKMVESHLTERRLNESQQRFRLATESAGIGFFEWDIANDTLTCDAQHDRIYGF